MYNWVSLSEQHDFTFLLKKKTWFFGLFEVKLCKRFVYVYDYLQDQIVDKHGINEDFMKILKNRQKIEILYSDQIETGDRSTQWRIEMLELDNEELEGKKTKGDFFNSIIFINSRIPVEWKTITVDEYYRLNTTVANQLKHETKLSNGGK